VLPEGYLGLVVCDTRRAQEWRAALRRRGFDVVLSETPASSDKGGWQVGVAAAEVLSARAFVREVTSGHVALTPPWYRQPGMVLMGLVVVGTVAAALSRAC
jgi:hypothetical protein